MIHIKDHKTPDMFDRFPYLGPKRKNLIETSWAKVFREHILPTLPVNRVFSKYDPVMGAPTKELYAILGLMVIQQMHDLTDDEAVSQFAFNMQWHYALNITSTADADAYVSPKTLWNMRDILTEQGIYTTIFEEVTKTLAEVFFVEVSKQRFDSVHIFSNMRHLGRLGLFVKTIKKFLVNLKRHHKDLYEAVDKAITDRYMTKQGNAVFSMVKPSESINTLATLADDVFTLVERFKGDERVTSMNSYQLLARLLKEQCIMERVDTHTTQVSVKANKDVPSDSLQNPSDPDAGYDGHKGKGYQVQIAESYGASEDTNTLNLITSVIVEPAHKSDANALIPLVESTTELGLKPKEVTVDSLYGSDENCQKAKALGVEVVSPVMGKLGADSMPLTAFTMNSENEITSCPEGCAPLKTRSKDDNYTALFSKKTCRSCSRKKACPTMPGKKGRYLRYDDKAIRLALRRAQEDTPAFRNRYRFRAGVEGTMSQLDRLTGFKDLRVRGLSAVSFAAYLKAAGINVIRAAAFRNRENEGKPAIIVDLSMLSCAVKERVQHVSAAIRHWISLRPLDMQFAALYAV
ncbi:MAG: transposase [Nitrospirae bacterium]|nr:transposase [Nitrospirota bacterium]